jgi:hypothetical protein
MKKPRAWGWEAAISLAVLMLILGAFLLATCSSPGDCSCRLMGLGRDEDLDNNCVIDD